MSKEEEKNVGIFGSVVEDENGLVERRIVLGAETIVQHLLCEEVQFRVALLAPLLQNWLPLLPHHFPRNLLLLTAFLRSVPPFPSPARTDSTGSGRSARTATVPRDRSALRGTAAIRSSPAAAPAAPLRRTARSRAADTAAPTTRGRSRSSPRAARSPAPPPRSPPSPAAPPAAARSSPTSPPVARDWR